jgi:hypothetical protein
MPSPLAGRKPGAACEPTWGLFRAATNSGCGSLAENQTHPLNPDNLVWCRQTEFQHVSIRVKDCLKVLLKVVFDPKVSFQVRMNFLVSNCVQVRTFLYLTRVQRTRLLSPKKLNESFKFNRSSELECFVNQSAAHESFRQMLDTDSWVSPRGQEHWPPFLCLETLRSEIRCPETRSGFRSQLVFQSQCANYRLCWRNWFRSSKSTLNKSCIFNDPGVHPAKQARSPFSGVFSWLNQFCSMLKSLFTQSGKIFSESLHVHGLMSSFMLRNMSHATVLSHSF